MSIFENTYYAGVIVLTCVLDSQSGSLLIVGRLLSGNHMGHTCNNLSTDVWGDVIGSYGPVRRCILYRVML